MKSDFIGLLPYTTEEFKELSNNAIVVLDTNVLLYFYRYRSVETREKLFEILEYLKNENRLWIPHQITFEYFQNYKKILNLKIRELNNLGDQIINNNNKAKGIIEDYYETNHTEEDKEFKNSVETACNKFIEEIENVLKKAKNKLPDFEKVNNDITDLIIDITGSSYTQEDINKIQAKGEKRYEESIPPGFIDKNEKDKQKITYGSISYETKYGDLILWFQIIKMAKDKQKPVIFVTEDKKEDWWEMDGKMILRPLPQLLKEFYDETGKLFYMYRIDQFVKHFYSMIKDVSEDDKNLIINEVEKIRSDEELASIDVPDRFSTINEYYEAIIKSPVNRKHENIIEALNKSIFYLENKFFTNLVLARKDSPETAEKYIILYDSLPKEESERIEALSSLIQDMIMDLF
ncbi:MAG: DUF4935 domain-containing protein [Clostridiaceae bacterium]|nr:DUF4935 domain-containing protein [Clostridiaceae bacterium]